MTVVDKLREAGYQVDEVKWDQDEIWQMQSTFLLNATMSQVGRIDSIQGEKIIPEFQVINATATVPHPIKKVAAML